MSRPTAQRPASWLAQEQTTFVGRAAELARLRAMLATSRLATVAGPGGVGKTRLALRAAAIAEPSFADGVCFAALSGLRDPELLPHTIAAALDLPEHDPRPRLEQVLDHLRDRHLLLILDTCEHLIEACALFAEAVLDRTERVTILATSREPLCLAGEHEYQLAPLAEGPDGDAVELFARRAAEAAPGFAGSGASRAEMARLCRLLDGIPLAIELAAVQLRAVSFEELGRRIESRHLDLARVRPDPAATARHQTLRDAIGWSHELCTPGERLLWERLSVFAGPVTAEAAAEVCAGPELDRDAVLNALVGLVGKSVVARSGGNTSRYGVLDTIREYGAERLAASGSRNQVRARHLRRYLSQAAELAARPLHDQVAKYRALRAEHDDLQAALSHAASLPRAAGPDGHPLLRLATDLEWYWVISARLDEGRYWITKGLERVPEPGTARAEALISRSYLAIYQGGIPDALDDIGEAIAFAEQAGDQPLRIRAHVYLAWIFIFGSRVDEARETVRKARVLIDPDAGRVPLDVAVMLGLAETYPHLLAGDPAGCLRSCRHTLDLLAGSGECWASGYLHGLAGLSLALLGQPGDGSKAVRFGLSLKQKLGDKPGLAQGLDAAALIASAQKRHERTAWLIGAAGPLWKQIGPASLGVEIMRMLTEQAAGEARAGLGDARYEETISDAGSRPLDDVVTLAVRDADRLPALPAPR